MRKVELLSPAGSLKHLYYAFAYGANAVYAGQPRYSLRVRNNDFDFDTIKTGIDYAHRQNKLFFIASNVIPHNSKVKTFMNDIKPIIELKPDALIMADPGLIMMIREKYPEQAIHLSVQANTVNYAAVKFWQTQGVKRIILSRELSLDEIKEIRQLCPDIELEVFVHGALCIAYSGRCLLSGYFNHRDSNQGSCTNSCRWQYDVKEAEQTYEGDIVKKDIKDAVFLLEEAGRKGELMPAYEDENGTYIMNSKDLRAVEHIDALIKIGINSLKIEGRTKSHYYAARTTQVYRKAIDDAIAGRDFDDLAFGILENLANRGYTDGFLKRHQSQDLQTYFENYSKSNKQRLVGEILEYKNNKALIDVKNKFKIGDSIEVITPDGCFESKVKFIVDDNNNESIDTALGSGYKVWINMPKINPNFGFIAKNFTNKITIKNKNIKKDNTQKIRRPGW